MTLLGTSVAQPDWQAQKLARAGEALSLVLGGVRDRKEKRRQQALAEINRLWQIGQEMPEVAAGAYGQSLVNKYGREFPEVPALVSAFEQRDKLRQRIERSGSSYLDNLAALEGEYQRQTETVGGMPDVVPIPMPWNPSGVPIPNVPKIVEQQRLSQVQPGVFPVIAAQRMPPTDRAAARLHPTVKSMLPTEFDPFSAQLSPEAHLGLAQQMGLLTGMPGMEEYAQTELGLKPTRAKLQEQKFQREERLGAEASTKAGREHQAAEREASHAEQVARIRLQDALTRGRQANSAALQKDVMRYQRSLNPREPDQGDKVSVKMLAQDNANLVKDWDYRLQAALQRLPKATTRRAAEKREEMRRRFIHDNGERPKLVPQIQLVRIAEDVNSREDLDYVARAEVAGSQLVAYMSKREVGKPAPVAAAEARQEHAGATAGRAPSGAPAASSTTEDGRAVFAKVQERIPNAPPAMLAQIERDLAAGLDPERILLDIFEDAGIE